MHQAPLFGRQIVGAYLAPWHHATTNFATEKLTESRTATQPRTVASTPISEIALKMLTTAATHQHQQPYAQTCYVEQKLQLDFKEGFSFLINGTSIDVTKVAPELYPLVQQRLLTTGMAALFSFHDCLQLHAGVVDFRGKRIMVLGQRGAGKSSFVCDAIAQGGRLVSDDVAIINAVNQCIPAFPAIRLFKNQPSPVGFQAADDVPGLPDKRYHTTDNFDAYALRPIDFIVHLVASDDIPDWQVDILSGAAKIQALMANLYRPKIIEKHPEYRLRIQRLMQYALDAKVVRICRPRGSGDSVGSYQSTVSQLPEQWLETTA